MARESRPGLDPLGLGVEGRIADLEVLGPMRNEPPAKQIEAPLLGPGIVPDHRQRIGRSGVPSGREIRRRPMLRDREDELNLADIGGEPDAATHGSGYGGAKRAVARRGPNV
jgi:hypothetical protein